MQLVGQASYFYGLASLKINEFYNKIINKRQYCHSLEGGVIAGILLSLGCLIGF